MKGIDFRHANGTLAGGPARQYGTEDDVLDLRVYRGEGEIISQWRASWWERLRILFTGQVWLRVFGQSTHPPVVLEGRQVFARIIFGPDLGNSGALIRWGQAHDNGIWISWRHWRSLKMWRRLRRNKPKGFTLGLLTVRYGEA